MTELLPTGLQYFAEVARTGSVTEAAAALHVAPSAISRQVAKLEASFDAPLFERHARGMALTDAGERVLAYTRRAEIETGTLLSSLGGGAAAGTRRITVAATEGFVYRVVPRAMAALHRTHPDVAFQLQVVTSGQATQMVLDGEADVAATYSLGHQEGVRVEHASTWPLFAVAGAGHPLAGRQTVTLDELAPFPLALALRETSQRRLLDSAARSAGLELRAVLECNSVAAIYEFVRSGDGMGFISELGAHAQTDTGLSHLRVDHPVFEQRSAQLQTPPGRAQSPAVLEFLRLLMTELDPDYTPERASQRGA